MMMKRKKSSHLLHLKNLKFSNPLSSNSKNLHKRKIFLMMTTKKMRMRVLSLSLKFNNLNLIHLLQLFKNKNNHLINNKNNKKIHL